MCDQSDCCFGGAQVDVSRRRWRLFALLEEVKIITAKLNENIRYRFHRCVFGPRLYIYDPKTVYIAISTDCSISLNMT